MEHAYHRDQPYVRREAVDTPWRTAAIIAAGVAAVELFIIVVIGVVLGAKLLTDSAEKAVITATTAAKTAAGTTPAASKSSSSSSSSSSSKKAGSASSTPVAKLSRKKTSVVVLNGNGVPGAAAVGAQRLRHFHYIVAATGNAPRTDFNRSLVMYRKGYEGEAIRLAHDLHIRRVAPLDGLSLRDLQGGHVALIIGG
jgi:LytR cell envelope-related transcriptional attenuator